ncbi:unnamed protein product [Rotaria sp. Silwood1]|nr:unnamed protein product [Rotaria sp. Silwood1]CAF1572125.1 unnamed protein product [Rotaria sp. Silwood1]CAF3657755.1 unnamed protein product [Rotaria sp. Silwood1]CAF3698488.1 unnamed protein product [Rotaria sp. Silwood1]CAF4682590.1 unnamed protein product [Rotaria sp. Silwood1]
MTATEQRTTDLFRRHPSSTVSCISSNVGSITDFLLTSEHSSLNKDEQLLENSKVEDISISENVNESLNELNISGNKEKLGHRRVDETGHVSYKRVMVDDLIKSFQIGLNYVLGKHHQPQRQVLFQDFKQVEYQDFPSDGSKSTPKHPYAEFQLKTYAQTAFRFFRDAFGIDPSSFMLSLCAKDLRELPNPGASGSIFYITADDAYVIKTVSKKEAKFLLSLLPSCYMNLTQNPFTLLPKFFGLFCYQSFNKNIRFVIMNNLIPVNVKLYEKYDLKGSIYKRKASEEEHKRDLPTLKDNDFKSQHPYGLTLEPFFYDQLIQTIEDDVQILSSFDIMDYSLLLAVHNITEEMKSTQNLPLMSSLALNEITIENETNSSDTMTNKSLNMNEESITIPTDSNITMTQSSHHPTYIQYLRVIEFIRAQQEQSILNTKQTLSDTPIDNCDTASIQTVKQELSPVLNTTTETTLQTNEESSNSTNIILNPNTFGLIGGDVWFNRQNLSRLAMAGIPAVNDKGDLLLLYVGIIDILQDYRLRKKLEHVFKSTLVTREEISVCNPSHYGARFVRFISHRVFRKGGRTGNTLLSDSQSNTDGITFNSSKLFNPSSSNRSQISDDSSSITNNINEIYKKRS